MRRNLMMVASGMSLGLVIGAGVGAPLLAQSFISWTKREVVPVVYVSPRPYSSDEFVAPGAGYGEGWKKSEVVPMIEVVPEFSEFVPQAHVIGVSWTRAQVKPFVEVRPEAATGNFIPARQ